MMKRNTVRKFRVQGEKGSVILNEESRQNASRIFEEKCKGEKMQASELQAEGTATAECVQLEQDS